MEDRLCHCCVVDVWMHRRGLYENASGETVKCGSVYTGLAGDFELMGIAARESQCIQDYKDQGFRRVPSAG